MYTIADIDDYRNKITTEQAVKLVEHCNKHGISPNICAWYDNLNDLYEDYKEHCDYSRETTNAMLQQNTDMFCEFPNGEIIKLTK